MAESKGSHLKKDLKRLGQDASFTLITQLAAAVLAFAVTVISARALGAGGQGLFYLGWTFGGTVLQFANMGLHSSNTYLAGRDAQKFPALLVNSAYLSLVVGGGAAVAVLIVSALISMGGPTDNSLGFYAMGAVLAPFQMFFLLSTELYLAIGRVKFFNALHLTRAVGQATAAVGCWLVGVTPLTFLALQVGVNGLLVIPLIFPFKRALKSQRSFESDLFKEGSRYALKAYLCCLFGFLAVRVNVYLVEAIAGEAALGQFSVAYRIIDALNLLSISVRTVLFPKLVRDRGRNSSLGSFSVLLVGAITTLGAIVIGLFAEQLLPLLFGDEYLPAAQLLRILLPGGVCFAMLSVQSSSLASIGFPRPMVWMWFWLFCSALGLSYFGTTYWGTVGACGGYSILCLMALIWQTWLTYRLVLIPERESRNKAAEVPGEPV